MKLTEFNSVFIIALLFGSCLLSVSISIECDSFKVEDSILTDSLAEKPKKWMTTNRDINIFPGNMNEAMHILYCYSE